jgi:plastocyanin
MSNKTNLTLVSFVAAILAVTAIVTTTTIGNANAIVGGAATPTVKVHAGGGNSTSPLTAFVPDRVQISVGQRVTWDNPSAVGEPHTVTFVLDNKTATDIASPFAVPNATQFSVIPPGSNNEPLKAPGTGNVVIALNARSYIPTVIDSQGNVKHFPPPNVNYSMIGSEKYVNSGWLIPKGQQFLPGSSTAFTVTFTKAGTYNYFCELHPWMKGSVVVK